MSFSGMIDQLFTDPVLSKPATYLVQGTTTPFSVRVISKQPDGWSEDDFDLVSSV